MDKDLFDEPIPDSIPESVQDLSAYDAGTFNERLARYEHLQGVFPSGLSYMCAPETHFVFQDIRRAYIAGCTTSVILSVQAYLEHYYAGYVCSRVSGFPEGAGLSQIIRKMRDQNLEHPYLLDQLEYLRSIRNPLSHLKPFDHPMTLSQRALTSMIPPEYQLELDSKRVIEIMFAVLVHSKAQSQQ